MRLLIPLLESHLGIVRGVGERECGEPLSDREESRGGCKVILWIRDEVKIMCEAEEHSLVVMPLPRHNQMAL